MRFANGLVSRCLYRICRKIAVPGYARLIYDFYSYFFFRQRVPPTVLLFCTAARIKRENPDGFTADEPRVRTENRADRERKISRGGTNACIKNTRRPGGGWGEEKCGNSGEIKNIKKKKSTNADVQWNAFRAFLYTYTKIYPFAISRIQSIITADWIPLSFSLWQPIFSARISARSNAIRIYYPGSFFFLL